MRILHQRLLFKVLLLVAVVASILWSTAKSEAHGVVGGFRGFSGGFRTFSTGFRGVGGRTFVNRGFTGGFRGLGFNSFGYRGYNYGYGGFGASYYPSFGYSSLYSTSYLAPSVVEAVPSVVVAPSVTTVIPSVNYSANYSYQTQVPEPLPVQSSVRQETVIRKIIEVHELAEPTPVTSNYQVQPQVQPSIHVQPQTLPQAQSYQSYQQVDPVPIQYSYMPPTTVINQETAVGYLSTPTVTYLNSLPIASRVTFLNRFYGTHAERLFTRHFGQVPGHLRGHFHHSLPHRR